MILVLEHQNTGKENRYQFFFFAILISALERFNHANKKICLIHFKTISAKNFYF